MCLEHPGNSAVDKGMDRGGTAVTNMLVTKSEYSSIENNLMNYREGVDVQ